MPLLNLKGYYIVESLEKENDCIYCCFFHDHKLDTSWVAIGSNFSSDLNSGFCSLCSDFKCCPLLDGFYFQKVNSQLSFADVHESDSDKK